MKLYQEHGISMLDWRSLLGSLAQMPIFIGMYQTLRAGANSARFLWVESLARPDPWFAILAGITSMLVMSVNPDLPEHLRLILIVVPGIVAAIAAFKFGLALYVTVSNCYSTIQTAVLHYVVARRIEAGVMPV